MTDEEVRAWYGGDNWDDLNEDQRASVRRNAERASGIERSADDVSEEEADAWGSRRADGSEGHVRDREGNRPVKQWWDKFSGREAEMEADALRQNGVDLLEGTANIRENPDALEGGLLHGAAPQASAESADLAAQREALAELSRASGGPGRDALAREAQMRGAAEGAQRGGALAAQQQMDEQGAGAAGGYLSALGASQNEAEFGANWQQEMARQRDEYQRAALQQMGQMGGAMRQQSATERSFNADAIDRYNKSNTDYRRGAHMRNTDRDTAMDRDVADAEMGRGLIHDRRADAAHERGRDQMGAIAQAGAYGTNSSGPDYSASGAQPMNGGGRDGGSKGNTYSGGDYG